jgi:hypothetical protein
MFAGGLPASGVEIASRPPGFRMRSHSASTAEGSVTCSMMSHSVTTSKVSSAKVRRGGELAHAGAHALGLGLADRVGGDVDALDVPARLRRGLEEDAGRAADVERLRLRDREEGPQRLDALREGVEGRPPRSPS